MSLQTLNNIKFIFKYPLIMLLNYIKSKLNFKNAIKTKYMKYYVNISFIEKKYYKTLI